MNNPLLQALNNEFKKFNGFMVSEQVKGPTNAAITFLITSPSPIPIESSSSPIITAFHAIVDNKKTLKVAGPLVGIMCSLIEHQYIINDAVSPIIRKIEHNYDKFDEQTALKVIQFTTSAGVQYFLEPHVIQSLLSTTFSYCVSDNKVVKTSAIAATEQIVKSFVEKIFVDNVELSPENRRDIDLCLSLVGELNISTTNPAYKLAYLVFSDLVLLGSSQKPIWLRSPPLPPGVVFPLLTMLGVDPFFDPLLEQAVPAAFRAPAPLRFFISIFESVMVRLPQISKKIFKAFLDDMNPKARMWRRPIAFFRIILFKNAQIIPSFYQNCDLNGSLLELLIQKLRDYTDAYTGNNNLEVSLSPKNEHQIAAAKNPGSTIPLEIVVYFTQCCFNSERSTIKRLAVKTWSNCLTIMSITTPYVSQRSLYVVTQGLHFLLMLATEMGIDDARGAVICQLCTSMISGAEETRQAFFETVTSAIETCPEAFNGHWGKVMPAVMGFEWIPDEALFSQRISIENAIELCLSILSINSADREWPLAFLVKILCANNARFAPIWSAVEGYFLLLIDDPESMQIALQALLEMLAVNFTAETEEYLLVTFNRLFTGRKKLPPEARSELLEEIRAILAERGTVIKGGWPPLIEALSPRNFQDEADILNLSFRCVQIICNDLLFLVDFDTKLLCTRLFFEFASQTTDINVSLSSFELMWSVVSMAKTTEMWEPILSRLVPLIGDKRNDVSLCAVRTFFSLIMSNAAIFPDAVVEYIARSCFFPIMEFFKDAGEEAVGAVQLAFHELAHCARTMYESFAKVDGFHEQFWPKLFEMHEEFYKTINKREIAVAAFQFYEESLMTHLSDTSKDLLFDSLERVITFTITRENANSQVWGAVGRIIRSALPPNKETLNEHWMHRWVKVMEMCIFDLDCGNFLPPTAHKSFDACIFLFPLPVELTVIIYQHFVRCATEAKVPRMVEVAIEHMCTICEKKVEQDVLPQLFVLSKDLFSLKQARRLLLQFVERDIEIGGEMLESVFSSLMKLGGSSPELREKTGNSIAKLFDRLSHESQRAFLDSYESCPAAMEALWARCFSKDSTSFNEELAREYLPEVVAAIGKSFGKDDDGNINEESTVHMLQFVAKERVDSEVIGAGPPGDCAHLAVLAPMLAELVMSDSREVREEIRKVLLRFSVPEQH